ncbi:hypothetical protein LARV_03557 [Longilinea arvoryzae]|uniref:Uncharacterized protein n=2 Tax=Longilinea arvoryzae TaxID=360412 RepID=A0A0S7BPK2_9CHLR|nr:hypothetical protein LARV_03557 [Longilinea arvoryzae]
MRNRRVIAYDPYLSPAKVAELGVELVAWMDGKRPERVYNAKTLWPA